MYVRRGSKSNNAKWQIIKTVNGGLVVLKGLFTHSVNSSLAEVESNSLLQ